MKQYIDLIQTILAQGVTKTDRTGTGTRSIFGYQTRFDLRDGFPLVTAKKTNFKAIAHELLWFISGDTNIAYLVRNGVNIWNDWPLKKANEVCRVLQQREFTPTEFMLAIESGDDFAQKYGNLGPVYGKQWRDFGGVDQLAQAAETIRTNPESRRIIVSAWNPAELKDMALPPCHAFFQFMCEPLSLSERGIIAGKTVRQFSMLFLRELNEEDQHLHYDALGIPRYYLSLQLYQRSADVMLGVPFNIASYALLLEMVAQVTGTIARNLVYTLGDAHIYSNHLDAAEQLLQARRYPLPRIKLAPQTDLFSFRYEDIQLLDYQHGPFIKLPVAV